MIPGFMNKLSCFGVRLVPRRFASWMAGRVLGKPRPGALPSRTTARSRMTDRTINLAAGTATARHLRGLVPDVEPPAAPTRASGCATSPRRRCHGAAARRAVVRALRSARSDAHVRHPQALPDAPADRESPFALTIADSAARPRPRASASSPAAATTCAGICAGSRRDHAAAPAARRDVRARRARRDHRRCRRTRASPLSGTLVVDGETLDVRPRDRRPDPPVGQEARVLVDVGALRRIRRRARRACSRCSACGCSAAASRCRRCSSRARARRRAPPLQPVPPRRCATARRGHRPRRRSRRGRRRVQHRGRADVPPRGHGRRAVPRSRRHRAVLREHRDRRRARPRVPAQRRSAGGSSACSSARGARTSSSADARAIRPSRASTCSSIELVCAAMAAARTDAALGRATGSSARS